MAKKGMKKKPDPFEEEGKRLRALVVEYAESIEDEEILLADGFEAAILGVTHNLSPTVVYDYELCVRILVERDGMKEEDAYEHMEFNVTGAYVGERTPIFIRTIDSLEKYA